MVGYLVPLRVFGEGDVSLGAIVDVKRVHDGIWVTMDLVCGQVGAVFMSSDQSEGFLPALLNAFATALPM
ncbi:hypothetical protein [Lichenicoccus sp.]|uniref:hypothetical protein n=1 Tax=Lichenicoccus sp. TaxID=2781899 RepID=UPI003D0B8BA4